MNPLRKILATSLGPGDRGKLYTCIFHEKLRCEVASFGETIRKLKGLQPGIAIAQSPERILACLQQRRRQRRQATEELNGICVLIGSDFQENALVNLTDIIGAKLSPRGQARRRRSEGRNRDVFHPTTTSPCRNRKGTQFCKDLTTEIVIVLDGSGSIDPEDYQQAKDFVYNMMKIFYEKCPECIFALVQYGMVIRTEFDLRVGRDPHAALGKVQAMRQVYNVTRTASAIQHVLDSIFTPAHGSQKNAAKIIVVLTDGEIFLDTLELETVIHSESMAGIERYAIGIGEAFSKEKALRELRLIASDPDDRHLFRVANYSALSVLLSTLQQKIIGLEGTAGDILEFELAQSGFSVRFVEERYIIFGAPGTFDWAGGVLLYDTVNATAVFLNETTEATSGRNSYLGYSVDVIHTPRGAWIVAGAPRHSMTGKVLVFEREGGRLEQTLQGEQIGSYYGSEICPLDINQDGLTDHLVVGAPFFHLHGEEGKVYVYRLDPESNQFTSERHLRGHPAFPFARFGFAVAAVGDVDQDGFGDVAVGAPLEGQELNPASCGSVYIFNGGLDGIRSSFSQRIMASQMQPSGLSYFGRALAGGLDLTGDGLPDIAVGSLGNVTLLRSRPVLRLEPTVGFNPGKISDFENSSSVVTKLCFRRTNPHEPAQPGLRRLLIRYTVDLDAGMERKRVQFEDLTETTDGEVLYAGDSCAELQLTHPPCHEDCFSHILLRLRYQLHDPSPDLTYPEPVLDIYRESERYFQLPYADDCENKTTCGPRLTLTVHAEKELLVVGSTKEVSVWIHLENAGGPSHQTTLLLEFPPNLHFGGVQQPSSVATPRALSLQSSSLKCKIGHPVFRSSARQRKQHPPERTRPACEIRPELHPQPIKGKNPFGAELRLQIWVPVFLNGHQLAGIKTVKGTQNSTVCKADDLEKVDFGHADPKADTVITFQQVSCLVFSEKEEVTVTAELPLANAVQVLKNGTELFVCGELAFDKNLYVGLNPGNYKAQIRVILLKENVFNYVPVIVGSSVSGFVLLILMTFFLHKCGFFKRNYQNMKEQEESLTAGQNAGGNDVRLDEYENLDGN
ncbi:hypothetical protein JRQ81_008064 [Phrynocephalus forsythii]|uniref:VWFA domain-containing protein n=1 Tax=Phrynocephalus forsythii TaxID=171643 RepID=A0A9Q1AT84_9SAUR|nr:hypothetical protein JRQ81_008064 [Phrynocephalus forsythii]